MICCFKRLASVDLPTMELPEMRIKYGWGGHRNKTAFCKYCLIATCTKSDELDSLDTSSVVAWRSKSDNIWLWYLSFKKWRCSFTILYSSLLSIYFTSNIILPNVTKIPLIDYYYSSRSTPKCIIVLGDGMPSFRVTYPTNGRKWRLFVGDSKPIFSMIDMVSRSAFVLILAIHFLCLLLISL